MSECNIRIGDRGMSKRIYAGLPPYVFTVVGIMPSHLINSDIAAQYLGIDMRSWEGHYPDCTLEGYICLCQLDKPEKLISRKDSQEYIEKCYNQFPYYSKMVQAGIINEMADLDYESIKEKTLFYLPEEDIDAIL